MKFLELIGGGFIVIIASVGLFWLLTHLKVTNNTSEDEKDE